MPSGVVNPGYMGWAKFGDEQFRFSDCNIAPKQEINAPDLVTGHWNRQAYNYGPVAIDGSISGPVGELFTAAGTGMWSKATTRTSCGALSEESLQIHYYCGGDEVTDFICDKSKVNSLNFSCSAGDVAQFSMDMIAADPTGVTYPKGQTGTFETPEKLITWDQVGLVITTPSGQTFGGDLFSEFNVTFANNVTAVYALGQANLFPYALVDGITTITGSVSAYNIPEMYGRDTWASYEADEVGTITFNVGTGLSVTLNVQWHRVEPTANVGPIISTVAFTGVTTQPAT